MTNRKLIIVTNYFLNQLIMVLSANLLMFIKITVTKIPKHAGKQHVITLLELEPRKNRFGEFQALRSHMVLIQKKFTSAGNLSEPLYFTG